ncbi:MAG: hypothetical protein WC301_05240, partial [Candidatus Omnitrophota bacterium]
IDTSDADDLEVITSGGAATKLSWLVQPLETVVANTPWNQFSIQVSDAYKNLASSAATITLTVTGGSVTPGASHETFAQGGIASFNNFAVYCGNYPSLVTVNATALGVEPSGPSNAVTIAERYTVNIKVLDSTNGAALADVTMKIIDASTGTLLSASGLTNPLTGNSPFRNLYLPYGTNDFNFSKEAYVDTTVRKTTDPAADLVDGTNDNIINWTMYAMSVAESLADFKVLSDFVYDEDADTISGIVRLEKKGRQILSDEINTLKTATLKIYDSTDDTAAIYDSSQANADTNGNYLFKITNAVASRGFVSGKSYFAKMTLRYGLGADEASTDVTYSAVNTFNIGIGARLKTWTSEIRADVAGVQLKVQKEGEATREAMKESTTEIKVDTGKILTATGTESLQEKLDDVKTKVVEEVQPHVRSGILNTESVARTGSKLTVRYRTDSGLAPVLSLYNPVNKLLVAGSPMVEIPATGIYEYPLTFLSAWGRGDFTIVCTEPVRGTVDALVIKVQETDIDEVSGSVSAILGSTTGLKEFGSVAESLNAQFSAMDQAIARINKNLVGKVEDAKGAVSELAGVFKQLEEMSETIKGLGGTSGISIEKLYEVSKDKQEDIDYIKNKSEELKAAMELNQKMIENVARKPVVQTWFEFK